MGAIIIIVTSFGSEVNNPQLSALKSVGDLGRRQHAATISTVAPITCTPLFGSASLGFLGFGA